jgi:hypothetical protein
MAVTTRLYGPWNVDRGQPLQPGGIDVSNWQVDPDPDGNDGSSPATVQVTAYPHSTLGTTAQLKVVETRIEVAAIKDGDIYNYVTTIQVEVQNIGTVPVPTFFVMISTVAAQ